MSNDYSRVELGALGASYSQAAYDAAAKGLDTSLYDPSSTSYDAYQEYLAAEGLDKKLLWAIEEARDEGDLAYLNWWYGLASKAAQEFWAQGKLSQASTEPSSQAKATVDQANQNRYLATKSQAGQNMVDMEQLSSVPGLSQLLQQLGGPSIQTNRIAGMMGPNLLGRAGRQQAYSFMAPPTISPLMTNQQMTRDRLLNILGGQNYGAALTPRPGEVSNLGAALQGYSGLI